MYKKRGQVTIFIIIAIVIVALGILVFMFFPKIKSGLGGETNNPSSFMQVCIEEELNNVANQISLQGGSLNPEFYYLYDNSKVNYLCYTNLYYDTCIVQEPMLKEYIEEEIKLGIENSAQKCLTDLKTSFEDKGYQVNLEKKDLTIELLPKKIVVNFGTDLVVSKTSTEKFDSINIVLNNNLYELISIVNSILTMEARYGDAETSVYMTYYHDLKVEKKKQTDGTTIYILTDRNDNNKFQFASRGGVLPVGYGI